VFSDDDDQGAQHNLRAAGCGQIVVRERHDKGERAEDPILLNIRAVHGVHAMDAMDQRSAHGV